MDSIMTCAQYYCMACQTTIQPSRANVLLTLHCRSVAHHDNLKNLIRRNAVSGLGG